MDRSAPRWDSALKAGALCLLCAAASAQSVVLTEGGNPAVSPEGTKIAFQRAQGLETWLGVLDLSSGEVRWLEKGPGHAAYPAWTRSGALLYSQGNVLHTAYENFKGSAREGYGIRCFEKGVSRELLPRGRWLDYAPAPAADGHTLWFVASRPDPKGAHILHSSLFKVDVRQPDKATEVYTPRLGHPCGVSQAAISPDGRHLVWGEEPDVHAVWCLKAARTDDFSRVAVLTPPDMPAYSPAWSPDGKFIAFTGYREGDDGWQIYLLDPNLGAVKRICRGEDPAFFPDGKSLAYDCEGKILRRALTADDVPTTADRWPVRAYRRNWTNEAERVLWRQEKVPAKPMSFPPCPGAAFGLTRTLFARARVVIPATADGKSRSILSLYYKDAGIWLSDTGMSFVLAVDAKNRLMLSVGNAIRWGQFVWSRTRLTPGREHVVTGIRTDGAIWVSVDNEPPECLILGAGQSPLNEMMSIRTGHPYGINGIDIRAAEVGAGWPVNVPKPHPFGGLGWEDIR